MVKKNKMVKEIKVNMNELWKACVANERKKGFRVENKSNSLKFVNLKTNKEYIVTETAIKKLVNSTAVRNSTSKQVAYNKVLSRLFSTAKTKTK
ncbi:hypothetical protein K5E_11310 [Enterococcus thailandicus]|uniref:hypothetical protein n=1 Tax=Enterococcus thailandicus TaxID=417368 RepID=UPI00244D9860|nr:hypothetical protein [Enterococcus thailandicus]GMC02571.1 hypothetical protein K4E_00810 [Enterococcus thailandicus]GMC08992.1 hypothetical protein K5E_11310 [Enterococcus thailandicus]